MVAAGVLIGVDDVGEEARVIGWKISNLDCELNSLEIKCFGPLNHLFVG